MPGSGIGPAIVNEALATYSDYAYRTALVVYLAAMVVHLGEYTRQRVAAPAVPATVGGPSPGRAAARPSPGRSRATW